MAWFEFIWLAGCGGNIEHLAEHGVTQDDFETVFRNSDAELISRSRGLPMRFGYTTDGRFIAIVYEWLEADMTVLPVTAFDAPERFRS